MERYSSTPGSHDAHRSAGAEQDAATVQCKVDILSRLDEMIPSGVEQGFPFQLGETMHDAPTHFRHDQRITGVQAMRDIFRSGRNAPLYVRDGLGERGFGRDAGQYQLVIARGAAEIYRVLRRDAIGREAIKEQ